MDLLKYLSLSKKKKTQWWELLVNMSEAELWEKSKLIVNGYCHEHEKEFDSLMIDQIPLGVMKVILFYYFPNQIWNIELLLWKKKYGIKSTTAIQSL